MRFTNLITKTMRTEPSEAETPSHRYLLKAGMISQVAAGAYTYLPLAWRSLKKIETIIREEMDAAGGQEVRMPALQPVEMWEESGRREAFGENLFTLKDRRGRTMVMAPTHEEVLSQIARTFVQSYRDLPAILYQIQTKFRDEPRPRGGLIRVREFDMKDAYSLNADDESLEQSYQAMARAYRNIYSRCGLPALMVEADSGAIGGKDSHEFMLPTASGEDTVMTCAKCGYTANLEKASSVKPVLPREPIKALKEIATPDVRTIEELSQFLEIPASKTLKAVFYSVDGQVVIVTIRGDMEVNEVKLKNFLKCRELRLASEGEVRKAGLVAGSASPIGLKGIRRIADDSIEMGSNFAVGANKADAHFVNANYPRDFTVDQILDIAQAQPGQQCPRCDGSLASVRGIEVGHIFKLGTVYSEKLGVHFLDREGKQRPVMMGCYGIGVGRLLAAAIEQNHDDKGMALPAPIAPYQAHLVGLNLNDPGTAKKADELYKSLWAEGFEVLFDDRPEETAGVKFNDADLLGMPVRLVISNRSLKKESIELKRRLDMEAKQVPIGEVAPALREALST
ncbi:MAG: proline--tRNA ligase [SAR202 cluster bacterium]|nr:proline--tRNA ligase [SAR202 cluster bacterium]